MSRLTCKTANGYCDMSIATRENKLQKLGQLEDIEEESGIDLILRHKIETSETAYIKNGNNEIIKGTIEFFYSKLKAFGVICPHKEYGNILIACRIDELGKTWALTKEELV